MIRDGKLDVQHDRVWCEGFPEWELIADVPELESAWKPAGPPPIPEKRDVYLPRRAPPENRLGGAFDRLMNSPLNLVAWYRLTGGYVACTLLYRLLIHKAAGEGQVAADLSTQLLSIGGLMCMGFSIGIWCLTFYRCWYILRDRQERTGMSPGLALGLLFVPAFNLYWHFRAVTALPHAYNEYADEDESSDRPHMEPRPFLWSSAMFAIYVVGTFLTRMWIGAKSMPLVTQFMDAYKNKDTAAIEATQLQIFQIESGMTVWFIIFMIVIAAAGVLTMQQMAPVVNHHSDQAQDEA